MGDTPAPPNLPTATRKSGSVLFTPDLNEVAVFTPVSSSASLNTLAASASNEATANLPRAGQPVAELSWYDGIGTPFPGMNLPATLLVGFDVTPKVVVKAQKIMESLLKKNNLYKLDFAMDKKGCLLVKKTLDENNEERKEVINAMNEVWTAMRDTVPWLTKEKNSAGIEIPKRWMSLCLCVWISIVAGKMKENGQDSAEESV